MFNDSKNNSYEKHYHEDNLGYLTLVHTLCTWYLVSLHFDLYYALENVTLLSNFLNTPWNSKFNMTEKYS